MQVLITSFLAKGNFMNAATVTAGSQSRLETAKTFIRRFAGIREYLSVRVMTYEILFGLGDMSEAEVDEIVKTLTSKLDCEPQVCKTASEATHWCFDFDEKLGRRVYLRWASNGDLELSLLQLAD